MKAPATTLLVAGTLALSPAALVIGSGLGSYALAQSNQPPRAVEYEIIGEFDGTKSAHHRSGGIHRMLVIDSEWDLRRFEVLVPELPAVDVSEHVLIVVTSWPQMKREIIDVASDGDVMIVKVTQATLPRWTDGYHPPKFIVAKAPAWPGPIRFELNGEKHHTVLKGEELERASAELWKEAMRLYKGGEPTRDQAIGYWRHFHYRNTDLSDDEILEKTRPHGIADKKHFFNWVFSAFADMRATPLVPNLFELSEQLKMHDPANEAVGRTLVAIGGEEVVQRAIEGLDSSEPRMRNMAFWILYMFGFPEFREFGHAALLHSDAAMNAGSPA